MTWASSKLELQGTASADDSDAVMLFNEALRHVPNPNKADQTLFTEVTPPTMSTAGDKARWRFVCQLKGAGSE